MADPRHKPIVYIFFVAVGFRPSVDTSDLKLPSVSVALGSLGVPRLPAFGGRKHPLWLGLGKEILPPHRGGSDLASDLELSHFSEAWC